MTSLRPTSYSSGPTHFVNSTDSTQVLARRLADRGAPEGTVAIAAAQQRGRGRYDRRWMSIPGRSLTFSYVKRGLSDNWQLAPLAVALAVADACQQCSQLHCQIKWPNDVLYQGKKLAGVLIEALPQRDMAIIGIGINVNLTASDFPDRLRGQATSLRIATGHKVELEILLAASTMGITYRLDQLATHKDAVLGEYRERSL